jgi:mono/diheme cytochrome c family protein
MIVAIVQMMTPTTLVASALWFWTAVIHHGRRRTAPGAVVSLFVVATGGAVLGVLLMFIDRPIYAISDGGAQQQLAGALMAGGGAFITGSIAMYVLLNIIRRGSERPVVRTRFPATPVVVLAIVGGSTAAALLGADAASAPSAEHAIAEPDLDAGAFLYGRDCASCHGIDGQGTDRGVTLEGLGGAGISYVLTTGRMPIPEPTSTIRRSSPQYDPDEIRALVAYAETLIAARSMR